MTLVLRSDRRAINHLGPATGYTGPVDFAAMLDFSRGDYFKMVGGNRVDLSLDQAVTVSRSSVGVLRRPDGSRYTVPVNAPRISHNSKYGMSGLLIEAALTNLVTNPANGSPVTIPSVSGFVVLSYKGGEASLSSPNLTLVDTFASGARSCKLYSRAAGTYAATLNVSGGATDIQAVARPTGSGYYPGNFLGYGGVQGGEIAQLGPEIVSLLAGGNYSVVAQVVMNEAGVNALNHCDMLRAVSGSAYGGPYARTIRATTANGTDTARTNADGGAATAGAIAATVTGTWNDVSVVGLTCQGNGATAGIISYGQYAKGSGTAASAPASFYIGSAPTPTGAWPVGGIISRIAIYSRMLTDDEAWAVANAWR